MKIELDLRFKGTEEQLEEFFNIIDGHLILFNEELNNDIELEIVER